LPSVGGPAVGARVALHGWPSNSENVLRFGLPKEWKDLETATDSDGRFSIRFDAPRAFQFAVDAKLRGHAEVSWRWGHLPVGEVVDVGEIVLTRTGSIAGRVVDREGKPASGDWRVYADTMHQPSGAGGDRTRASTPADAITGEFRLEDLPPGPARLTAWSRIANWIDGPTVAVAVGEEARADVVYDGPDNRRRISVVAFTEPFHIFSSEVGPITLHGGPVDPLLAKKIEGSSQSWSFDDLDPGSYTVEIGDPRFRRWARSGVSPGSTVEAHLAGSAAVALTVVEEANRPIHDYRLLIRFRFGEGRRVSPDLFELRGREAQEPPAGRYAGLVPGDSTLLVEAPGFAVAEAPVDDLKPGEERAVGVSLQRGATIAGVVVRSDGATPVEGARVSLEPAEAEGTRPLRSARIISERSEAARATATDSAGRFEFRQVPSGHYRVRAVLAPSVAAERETAVEGTGPATPLTLALPGCGTLRGRLVGPAGARFDGLKVSAEPSGKRRRDPLDEDGESPSEVDVAADGSFLLGPLPAGLAQVSALIPEHGVPSGFDSGTMSGSPRVKLGRAEIRDGEETRADFDLSERFPGALQIRVTVDGRSAAGFLVEFSSDLGGIRSHLDAEGSVRLAPIFAGSWTPRVLSPEDVWAAESAAVRVPAGGEATARVDVKLTAGTLQVLERDSGTPLADQEIFVRCWWPNISEPRPSSWLDSLFFGRSMSGLHRSFRTDGEGRVQLRLPPGRYEVEEWGEESKPGVPVTVTDSFEWPPPEAAPAKVRLPRLRPADPELMRALRGR
jgi:hypothetical protein